MTSREEEEGLSGQKAASQLATGLQKLNGAEEEVLPTEDEETGASPSAALEADEEELKPPYWKRLGTSTAGCLKTYWKALLAITVLYSIGLIFSTYLQHEVESTVNYFEENGAVGAVLFVVSFTILLQVGVPATVMEIGAAFLFEEFYQIFLINTLSKNLGRAVGFGIGKYVLFNWVQKNLLHEDKPLTIALSRLMKREPLKYSTLWGFAFVPTWSQTFGSPVLGCPFVPFMVASNISGIPYTVLMTFVGMTAKRAIDDVQNGEDVDGAQIAATAIGAVFLVVTVIMLGHYVKKELKVLEEEELQQHPVGEEPNSSQPPVASNDLGRMAADSEEITI